jgi:hypothetical protein
VSTLSTAVGEYISTIADDHSASGEDILLGPSNKDVYNSSVPFNIDRTGLSLAEEDMDAPGTLNEEGPFPGGGAIDDEYHGGADSPIGIINTAQPSRSRSSSLSGKVMNQMEMSKTFFNESRGIMGDMDRLVATLHDHDEYEELFDASPDEVSSLHKVFDVCSTMLSYRNYSAKQY